MSEGKKNLCKLYIYTVYQQIYPQIECEVFTDEEKLRIKQKADFYEAVNRTGSISIDDIPAKNIDENGYFRYDNGIAIIAFRKDGWGFHNDNHFNDRWADIYELDIETEKAEKLFIYLTVAEADGRETKCEVFTDREELEKKRKADFRNIVKEIVEEADEINPENTDKNGDFEYFDGDSAWLQYHTDVWSIEEYAPTGYKYHASIFEVPFPVD